MASLCTSGGSSPGLSVRVGVSVPKFGITTWGERGTVASGD